MLKKLLIVSSVLVCNVAVAQRLDRTEINRIIKGLNPITLKNQGQDGVWFSNADAEKILGILEQKLPQALDIIDAQDQQLASYKLAIDLYRSTISSYDQYADYNKQMLDTALKYFPELRPPTQPWYEKPALIYIGGVLTGAAVVVISAYALSTVHK